MRNEFNKDIEKIIIVAENIAFDFGHSYVESEHLLLSLLKENGVIKDYFKENFNITYSNIEERVIHLLGKKDEKPNYLQYSQNVRDILNNLNKASTVCHILFEILKKECIANEILKEELNEDQYKKLKVDVIFKTSSSFNSDSYNTDHLIKDKLCKYSFITLMESTSKEQIILGRDEEVKQVLVGLCCQEKSNVALVGKTGVGKTAIVEEVARQICHEDTALKGYLIVKLNINSMVAGTKYRGEFEEKVDKYIKTIENQKVITFIDEGHDIIGAGKAEGSTSLGESLKPILARSGFKFIIATTDKEYEIIQKDAALNRRFRKVAVEEPAKDKVFPMIKMKIKQLENFHGLSISKDEIEHIINETSKIKHRFYPDKVLDVLDYTFSYSKVCGKQNFCLDYSKSYIDSLIKESKEIEIRERKNKRKEDLLCQ